MIDSSTTTLGKGNHLGVVPCYCPLGAFLAYLTILKRESHVYTSKLSPTSTLVN